MTNDYQIRRICMCTSKSPHCDKELKLDWQNGYTRQFFRTSRSECIAWPVLHNVKVIVYRHNSYIVYLYPRSCSDGRAHGIPPLDSADESTDRQMYAHIQSHTFVLWPVVVMATTQISVVIMLSLHPQARVLGIDYHCIAGNFRQEFNFVAFVKAIFWLN